MFYSFENRLVYTMAGHAKEVFGDALAMVPLLAPFGGALAGVFFYKFTIYYYWPAVVEERHIETPLKPPGNDNLISIPEQYVTVSHSIE